MPARTVTRRRALAMSAVTLAGLTGCVSESSPSDTSTSSASDDPATSERDSPTTEDTPSQSPSTEETRIDTVAVADFVLYPLAGVHPHVHRRGDTQYVIVRSNSPHSQRTLRERLTLTLDGDPAPLADRQPAGFETDTDDVAFAVSKGETYESGRIMDEQTERRTLSASTLDRLNNPPVFEVSNPTVSSAEIQAGVRTDATVRFEVHNTGEGSGTFGASVSGNLVSGSATVTATLDSGTQREVSSSTPITGDGDEATVRLDWGTEEWSRGIPVVGTPTTPESPTETPYPQ